MQRGGGKRDESQAGERGRDIKPLPNKDGVRNVEAWNLNITKILWLYCIFLLTPPSSH